MQEKIIKETTSIKDKIGSNIFVVFVVLLILIICGAIYLASLKIKLVMVENKNTHLEEALGMGNTLFANSPVELSLIGPFGTSTATTSFTLVLDTILPPTPEALKLMQKGENPKMETKREAKTINISPSTIFSFKKLTDFKEGDMVRVIYREHSSDDTSFVAIRVEQYVENGTATTTIRQGAKIKK